MSDAFDQVGMILHAALFVAPLGVYMLILGVQCSRPTSLVDGRRDFGQLAVVFLPILLSGLVALQAAFGWMAACAGGLAALVAWMLLLPARGSAYVIYNLSANRFEHVLSGACRSLGLPLAKDDEGYAVGGHLRLYRSHLSILRTISFTLEAREADGREAARRLVLELQRRCHRQQVWPTSMGMGLVVAGCGLIMLPATLFAGHMPAVAEVVRRFVG